jgi:hypothetical protein
MKPSRSRAENCQVREASATPLPAARKHQAAKKKRNKNFFTTSPFCPEMDLQFRAL